MFEQIAPPTIYRVMLPGNGDAVETESALGFPLARLPGQWSDGPVSSLRTRPGEWLVRDAISMPALSGLGHVASLTASMTAWRVSGPDAATLLAMGGTLDFATFAPKSGARTLIARIPAVISRIDDDAFEILVDRVHADYFGTWIATAAQRFAEPLTSL